MKTWIAVFVVGAMFAPPLLAQSITPREKWDLKFTECANEMLALAQINKPFTYAQLRAWQDALGQNTMLSLDLLGTRNPNPQRLKLSKQLAACWVERNAYMTRLHDDYNVHTGREKPDPARHADHLKVVSCIQPILRQSRALLKADSSAN